MQSHGQTSQSKRIVAPHSRLYQGPFGRMFRNLPAWQPEGEIENDRLETIEQIARSMVEPNNADQNPDDVNADFDNQMIPAGYTYFGQFIDHDLTLDVRSSLQRQNDPEQLENFRTPAFDLDCIYGRGPGDQPYMFDGGKFIIGSNGPDDDLPRANPGGTKARRAIIGDKRNDENTMVSQLQLTFLKFHNAVFDGPGGGDFDDTQRIVRWHFQWAVVNDLLKRLCGAAFVDGLLAGSGVAGKPNLNHYNYRDRAFMPVEFSVAAYRLGHSMVRPSYRINDIVPRLPVFDKLANNNPLGDFRGFRELPGQWTVDWARFFDLGGSDLQFSRKLDRLICQPLANLPGSIMEAIPGMPPNIQKATKSSLAFANLLRGWRLGLPSGNSVAHRLGLTPIVDEELPLWTYILDEAASQHGGSQLGDVGAAIVGETFIGLLAADPSSFYSVAPNWQPELPVDGANFEMADIVRFVQTNFVPAT